jgi:ATP/maltotriose-dependent transcriptional regulator MalT
LGDIGILVATGQWNEALARSEEVEQLGASRFAQAELVETVGVLCERGELAEAERVLDRYAWLREAEQGELAVMIHYQDARLLRAQGRPAEALEAAERGLAFRSELAVTSLRIKLSFVEALEAALALDDLARTETLLTSIEALHPGELTPFLRAQAARFRAIINARYGRNEQVDGSFRRAEAIFREFGVVFYLAVTHLEHAEWLVEQGRGAEAGPLLAEARETFEQLGATPWLSRITENMPSATVTA